jgi:hypothetical protein
VNGTHKKTFKTYINVNFIKSLLVSNIDLKFRSWIMVVSKRSHIYFLEKKTKGLDFQLIYYLFFLGLTSST